MVSIVFAGPSLTSADRAAFPKVQFRAPAAQGDVLRCIVENPKAIGIIDGYFGDRLAVHQKEILEAMAQGIPVWGGASMGALRASELNIYGMRGVGSIFQAYLSGAISSDADVAVTHGPEELDFLATSISMVDVRATVAALRRRRVVSNEMLELIMDSSLALHFSDRTWQAIAAGVQRSNLSLPSLEKILTDSEIQQKRLDAIEVLRRLTAQTHDATPARIGPPLTTYYKKIRNRALSKAT